MSMAIIMDFWSCDPDLVLHTIAYIDTEQSSVYLE